VDAQVYDEAVDRVVDVAAGYEPGDPHDEKTRLGPLVSATQRDRVRGYIKQGLREGGRLVLGGGQTPDGLPRGYYMAPTVFADVSPDAVIAQNEIFGPVLCVMRFDTEEDALAIANNSRYGLAGAVWAQGQERAIAFARKMETGSVDVNGGRYNPLAPFGGYKESGIGREMGRWGLEEFLHSQSLQI
jgi:aldehyde dehydrogenase (NAD+)